MTQNTLEEYRALWTLHWQANCTFAWMEVRRRKRMRKRKPPSNR
jgi:hypothetical protein